MKLSENDSLSHGRVQKSMASCGVTEASWCLVISLCDNESHSALGKLTKKANYVSGLYLKNPKIL